MKYLVGLFFSSILLFAQTDQLIIDAQNFETDDSKGISIFTGNVKLRMAKDKLNSEKLEIYVKPNTKGKEKQPIKYVATGDVNFVIFSKDKHYKGKGDKLIYNPIKSEYEVIGNGYIKEETEKRELFGEKIFINQLTGNAIVSGSKDKPVRFILNIENGNK